jgi:hypothetical protein
LEFLVVFTLWKWKFCENIRVSCVFPNFCLLGQQDPILSMTNECSYDTYCNCEYIIIYWNCDWYRRHMFFAISLLSKNRSSGFAYFVCSFCYPSLNTCVFLRLSLSVSSRIFSICWVLLYIFKSVSIANQYQSVTDLKKLQQ